MTKEISNAVMVSHSVYETGTEISNTKVLFVRVENELYVSFSGTDELADVLTDVSAFPSLFSGIHSGFDLEWSYVKDFVKEELGRRYRPGMTVFFCGHSLGGALAQLACFDLRMGCAITFGSPRVFVRWKSMPKSFRHIRVFHTEDQVPTVPFFLYSHKQTKSVSKQSGLTFVEAHRVANYYKSFSEF